MIAGIDISEDAKMTGITPAVLTFSGITEALPPTRRLPCIFLEYCTGMFLVASFKMIVNTTSSAMHTMMMIADTTPTATFSLRIKVVYSSFKSPGREERMLNRRTMEIPFPTPYSVICSPIHISRAEPAVMETTQIMMLMKL